MASTQSHLSLATSSTVLHPIVGNGVQHLWQEALDRKLRSCMLYEIECRLDHVFPGRLSTMDLRRVSANFENKFFHEANSKEEYIRKVAHMLDSLEGKQNVVQQQIQIGRHMRPVNALQAKDGGNSSTVAMSQGASMMSSHGGRSPQMQSQLMAPPPSQKHPLAMQIQDSNFIHNLTSIAQAQEQSVQPNGQQNHLPMQSARGTSMLLHEQMIINQQDLGLNQQQMDRQRYHYATKMHNGHPDGGNSQHNAGFTISKMESQQVMMERAVEVDWREEMSQQIKKLKDDCFSELMELHQGIIYPNITKEQLEALPKRENVLYRSKLYVKEKARVTLNFLLLDKDKISENLRGKFSIYEKSIEELLVPYRKSKAPNAEMDARMKSQISHGHPQTIDLSCDLAPSDGGFSSHHKQQKPPISSCFPEKSHGSLQPSPINKLQEDFILPLLITNPGGLVVKQDALKVATLSSDLVKFTLPSPVSMTGVVPAASTCDPVMPTSSENFKSVSASQLVDNSAAAAELAAGGTATEAAAANESEQVNPIMTATPIQVQIADSALEGNHHGGAETVAAKKPIDHLIEAVRASSPAMLYDSANSICTVSMNDLVPHWEIDESQDWDFFSEQGGSSTANKMKHILESTSPCLEPSPPGDRDGSWIPFDCNASEVESNAEHGTKRQKTTNTKDALLDEIKSTNSRLLDTVISIVDDSGTDAITSRNGGTLVEFSYTAISLSPDLKLLFAASEMPIILPVKLLVPVDYPRTSPVLVGDQWDEPLRKSMSNILGTAEVSFRYALNELPKPMTVRTMARVWDDAVRKAIVEFAKRHGGGTFSSTYGLWERC